MQQLIMNSKSIKDNELSSLKSKRSNKKRIFSSNLASEKITSPEKSSSASISPFLSVSKMTKLDSEAPNICSNSVKSIEKLSQTLLKEPWNSLSFPKETVLFVYIFMCFLVRGEEELSVLLRRGRAAFFEMFMRMDFIQFPIVIIVFFCFCFVF